MKNQTIKNATVAFVAVGVAVVIAIAYARVIGFGWAWDDYLLFVESTQLRSESVQWSALIRPIISGTSYFRPLVLLSFVLEFKALGVGAGAAHAVNLGIFICNGIFVFAICLQLFPSLALERPFLRATLAALAYGLHPAMIEPVAWVSGRFDLLCTSFALIVIALALTNLREWGRAWLIGTAFGAALLCKEMAITLPFTLSLVLLAQSYCRTQTPLSGHLKKLVETRWPTAVIMIVVTGAYLLFKFVSIGKLIHFDHSMVASISGADGRIALVLRSLAFYLSSAFVPFAHLSPFHSLDFATLTAPAGVAICVAVLAVVLLTALGTARCCPPACLFLAFIVSLLPVLQIIPLTIAGSIGAERFLAMPLAFLVLSIFSLQPFAASTIRVRTQVFASHILLCGWFLLAAACLYVTVPLWRTDLTLWTWTYQQNPDSKLLRQSYVVAALREGDFKSAETVFKQMLAGDGFDPVMQMIYGNYLIKKHEDEEGIAYLEGAIAVFPRPDLHPDQILDEANYRYLAYGFSSLAIGYLELHNYDEALKASRLSQWYRPYSDTAKLWESLSLYGLGRKKEAEEAFELVLKWQPEAEHPMMFEQRDRLLHQLETESTQPAAQVLKTIP